MTRGQVGCVGRVWVRFHQHGTGLEMCLLGSDRLGTSPRASMSHEASGQVVNRAEPYPSLGERKEGPTGRRRGFTQLGHLGCLARRLFRKCSSLAVNSIITVIPQYEARNIALSVC